MTYGSADKLEEYVVFNVGGNKYRLIAIVSYPKAGLPESTLSEVLLGRRRLNTRHIGILARYFRIDPGVFLDALAE